MNTLFTKDPIVGSPLTPSTIRAINTAVRRYMPIAGAGIRISYTAGGSIIACTVKPRGGSIGESVIYPFKCEAYDHYPESTTEEPNPEADYEGYHFFLPSQSLLYKGAEIQFAEDKSDFREDSKLTTGAWKVWEEITKESVGVIYCLLLKTSSTTSSGDDSAGGAETGAGESSSEGGDGGDGEESEASYEAIIALYEGDTASTLKEMFPDYADRLVDGFPVCKIAKYAIGESESGEGSRIIEQYVFGEVVIVDNTGTTPQPFDIFVDTDKKSKVTASDFYFNGELQEDEISENLELGGEDEETVYLVCKKTDSESSSTGYEFSLELEPDDDDTSINVKLYDLKDGEVTMDYRGENLPIVTPHTKPNDEPFYTEKGQDGITVKASDFWFDGELKEVTEDLTVGLTDTATVYLVCTKGSNDTWSFELSTTAGTSDDTINVKLYDFTDGEITMDYRGANLPVVTKKESSEGYPKPFDFNETSRTVGSGDFYFNGTLTSVAGGLAIGEDSSDTVYLNGTKADADSEDYTFKLETSPASGDDVISLKLYTFSDGKVSNDYRATFLTFTKPSDATISIKENDKDGTEPYDTFTLNQKEPKTLIIPKGKLIKKVEASHSSAGKNTTVKFTYSDDSTTEIVIADGADGLPGPPGADGVSPEIEFSDEGEGRHIVYVDGEQVCVIKDGTTPTITGSKSGKVTTIYANGKAIATINDGTDGSGTSVPSFDFISDIGWQDNHIAVKYGHWNGIAFSYDTTWTNKIETTPITTLGGD